MLRKFGCFLVGLLILTGSGCEKKDYDSSYYSRFGLYLVDRYSTIDNSYQIDESSVVTKKTPLILYSDFLSYDSAEYTFEVSERAIQAIKSLEHSVHGLAFAIKADNQLIYTGYFWPGYSSASCNWMIIDPMMVTIRNKIQVHAGYPGLIQGQVIPDKRNDPRIIQIFKQDNKLK